MQSRARYWSMAAALLLAAVPVYGSMMESFTITHSAYPGLIAEVTFTIINPTTLEVRAKNTSTGVPVGFDSADQLLTGVSWDFGDPGYPGDVEITGGSVVIGPTSQSVNFSTGSYGAGYDVSGEYGYGNMDGSGALPNFVSGNTAQATPFGGANLDGPAEIDGPQAGLVADPILVDLGGLGAIQNEFVATLTLSDEISDLDFLFDNGIRIEFGSDAAFTPEPSAVALMMFASLGLLRRRRHTK